MSSTSSHWTFWMYLQLLNGPSKSMKLSACDESLARSAGTRYLVSHGHLLLAPQPGHHVQRSTGHPSHTSKAPINALDIIETPRLVDECVSACGLSTVNVTWLQGSNSGLPGNIINHASTSMGCSQAREVSLRQNVCLFYCRNLPCRLGLLECPPTALKAPGATALHRQWLVPDQHI